MSDPTTPSTVSSVAVETPSVLRPELQKPPTAKPIVLLAALALVVSVWLVLRVIFFVGFTGSDDMYYTRFALLWDRVPANHWEVRIPFNAAVRASFKLFGYGEVSSVIPNMAFSLLMVLAAWGVTWRATRSIKTSLMAGVLVASLPVEIHNATTIFAREGATTLLLIGAFCVLYGKKLPSAIVGGICLAAAVQTHVFVIYLVGLVLVIACLMRVRSLRDCAAAGAVMAAVLAIFNICYFGITAGNPLHVLSVSATSHLQGLSHDPWARHAFVNGHFDLAFLTRPIVAFVNPRSVSAYGALALLLGAFTWRFCDPPLRALIVWCSAGWLWMSYGTQTPTAYMPFPGTLNYWQPILVGGAIVLAFALCSRFKGWKLAAAAGVIIALNVGVLCMGAPLGQTMRQSRHVLAYVQQHPENKFVASRLTLAQLTMWNGHVPLENCYTYSDGRLEPGTDSYCVIPKQAQLTSEWRVIVVPTKGHFGTTRPAQEETLVAGGTPVFATPAIFRPMAWLLPARLRNSIGLLKLNDPVHVVAPSAALPG